MARYIFPAEFKAELKARCDITSVVGSYVQLERKGSRFWACCPFHHEKTPSFCIDEVEGIYHCFGCKEGGDVINFVQKIENCDFPMAMEILAKRAGMQLPEMQDDDGSIKKRKEDKDRCLKVLALACNYYKENLYKPQAAPAQDYIKKRGLTKRELDDFELGYSLGFKELITYLSNKGVSESDMVLAGVAQTKNGNTYDVISGRLVFPIFDSFGDCIGFSGRILGKADFAKYLNTAETPLFYKSKVVYGIHLIKKLKQQEGIKNIVLVEGQMDVIAMHKAGFRNSVACLGSAVTADHARELKRFSDKIILCMDGDEAGIKAALRSIDILLSAGLNVSVVKLPSGTDPDDYVKEFGPGALREKLENAMSTTDFKILVEQERHNLENSEGKAGFIKIALDIIRELNSSTDRDIYLKKLKEIVNIPLDVLRRDLGQAEQTKDKSATVVLNYSENGNIKANRFILASLLYKKDYAKNKIDLTEHFKNQTERQLYKFILDGKKLNLLYDEFDVDNEPVISEAIGFDFSAYAGNEKKYFDECVWLLIETGLKERQEELTKQFKEVSDIAERRKIAAELTEIIQKLKDKRVEN